MAGDLELQVLDMEQHVIKTLLDKQLCVSIHSDDPAYFGGYVEENYMATQEALELSKEDIYQLANNSIEASFLGDEAKQELFDELDGVYEG